MLGILVGHALGRMERGPVGFLYAEGEEGPEVLPGGTAPGSGHRSAPAPLATAPPPP